ncbi:hypothetical protein [Nocardia puris]|uniref:hypothetical protein n=1 Tax=Nocardia puris TaxID=208602 RepID=UPI0011BEAE28|nr:hypothetical protein [Nocardia puris]
MAERVGTGPELDGSCREPGFSSFTFGRKFKQPGADLRLGHVSDSRELKETVLLLVDLFQAPFEVGVHRVRRSFFVVHDLLKAYLDGFGEVLR